MRRRSVRWVTPECVDGVGIGVLINQFHGEVQRRFEDVTNLTISAMDDVVYGGTVLVALFDSPGVDSGEADR